MATKSEEVVTLAELQRAKDQASRIERLEKEARLRDKKHEAEASVGVQSSVQSSPLIFSSSSSSSSTSSSPSSYSAPKPDLKVAAEEVRKFLDHVAAGQQDEAEAMLKKNCNLALATGTVTDHAKRTFKNITGFQYAVWALDWQMWRMIRKYLTRDEAEEQAKGFAEGSWVTEHGEHADWKRVTEAQQTLIDNWGSWSVEKINKHWVQQIGRDQILLPRHVLQEYNQPERGFVPCPTFEQEYTLSRRQIDLACVGVKNAIRRGGIHSGMAVIPEPRLNEMEGMKSPDWLLADRAALTALFSTRTKQRAELVSELTKKPGVSPSKK